MEQYLKAQGRQIDDMKFSLMTRVIYRRTQAQLDSFLQANDMDADALRDRGLIIGTASQVADQLGALVEAGVDRFMLQWMELDDMGNLELLARDVLPHFSKSDSTQFVASKTPRLKRRSTRQRASKVSNVPRVPNVPKVPRIRNVRKTRR